MQNVNNLEIELNVYYAKKLTNELRRDITKQELKAIKDLIVEFTTTENIMYFNKISKDLKVDFIGWNNKEYNDLILCS